MIRKQPPNGRDRRPKTVSISLGDRGQTTQDFAVGIGVFILAVAFVFSFMPSILTPFDSTVSGGQTAQADRIADQLVANLSSEVDSSDPNRIHWDDFREYADDGGDGYEQELATEFGLRTSNNGALIDRMNVSIQTLGGEPVEEMADHTVGRVYEDQSAASSARIVSIDDPGFDEPAYRVVVRIW